MDKLVIESIEPSDFSEVLEILNHEITHSTSNFAYATLSTADLELIISKKKEEGFPYIVARLDNRVCGFGTFGPFRPKEGYRCTIEHSVYINQKFQGKGIGFKIFQALKNQAIEGNYTSMIAAIGDENINSIEFHKKLGFKEVGYIPSVAYKFDRSLNLVLMQLLIK